MNLLQQFVNFLTSQKDKSSFSTVKNYKADIGQFITWFEAEFKSSFDPSNITLLILEHYKKVRNLSPSSIQRHVFSLRKFFHFLKATGVINFELFPVAENKNKIEPDPWMLRNFKSYLYEYKKSNLTIKNYINDVKSFFVWLGEVALVKYAWNVADKNLLDKINFSVIAEYKQRLIKAKFSPVTINRKLSSLRSYVGWAKSQRLISSGNTSDHTEFLPANALHRQVQASIPVQDDKVIYSSFPPARLMRKSLKGANYLFDNLFISPLAQTLQGMQYLFWKTRGKKVFIKSKLAVKDSATIPISNIQKEFYAPLSISTRYLPTHKRVWHYIRYVRPNWYKKYHSYSLTHYFHFAVLMILSCAIGFGIYNSLFADTQKGSAILGTATSAPPRILSFQGKLTDSQDNPITTDTNVLFSIYSEENASKTAFLWQETNLVKSDSDGTFSLLLGKNTPIPDVLFSQNPELFLGIAVGDGPELSPRQQLATVPLANNAKTLQGLEPITNTTKVSNVVLALDSSGNLSIAGTKAHTFQVIGGNLVLSGKILSLTTVPGSNSNIEIVPDGVGKIDLSRPIQNSTNNNNLSGAIGAVEFDDNVAILATTSAQSAFYINQNSMGPLISASTSGIAKFAVGSDGTGMYAGDLGINGGDLTSSATTFNLLGTGVTTLNIGREAMSLFLGTASGSAVIESSIILGNSNANTITFNGRVARDSSLVPITADGTNNLGSSSLPWDNAYINNIYAVKLDVQDSQSATAAAQIFNTNTGTDADGLIIKLGSASPTVVSATNHFISFETSGIGIVGSIRGNGVGKGVTYETSGIADFAEYFRKDVNQTIEFGSVVCLKDNGLAVKCGSENSKIIGVASERPAFLGGQNLGNGSIAVGLVGQVETLVAGLNGEIKAGDMLTASDIPGVAVKAIKAGQIIGKSLEDLTAIDESRVAGFYDPDNKEYRNRSSFPNIPLKGNIVRVVKIPTLVNVSWYDPEAYLAQNGDFVINNAGSNGYSVANSKNETLTNIGGFWEVISANIKAGLVNASEVITNTLIVTSDTIIVNGQNLKDYIVGVVGGQAGIISPVASIDRLSANIISPLDESLIVRLATPSAEIHNSEFIIQNSSGSAVAKIDDQGNASFSGTINSQSLEINDASISGTLRAGNIIADSITGLEAKISNLYSTNFADLASYSAQLSDIPDLAAQRGQFSQGLMVFGPTSLSDLSIAGTLSVGGTMFITENSIEILGTDLSLQSLRQGGLSIMSGLVYIDTEGNIKVQGNLSVTGKLAVSGDIAASGSGTFAKLNFSLIAPVLAVSATEVIASSSAGVANIAPYQSEITIRNALVTDKSVIYITPVGTPSAQTPFLMRQLPQESFTVGVESPTNHSLDFNWLIIN